MTLLYLWPMNTNPIFHRFHRRAEQSKIDFVRIVWRLDNQSRHVKKKVIDAETSFVCQCLEFVALFLSMHKNVLCVLEIDRYSAFINFPCILSINLQPSHAYTIHTRIVDLSHIHSLHSATHHYTRTLNSKSDEMKFSS